MKTKTYSPSTQTATTTPASTSWADMEETMEKGSALEFFAKLATLAALAALAVRYFA